MKNGTNSGLHRTLSRADLKEDKVEEHYKTVPWILGAFGRILGLKFAPINIPLERRLQTAAALFWMCTFLFMGFGSLFLLLYLFFYTRLWWISVAYLTWYIGDYTICNRGGRRWNWIRRWTLWRHFKDFFPIHLVKTAPLDPSKNYILGYHPHGILCAGAFSCFATEGTDFSKTFPGITPYLLTLQGHFELPLYREFLLCSGTVSASRESINYLLGHEGTGVAVALVVGGARESLDCHPGKATLHLSMRKGFIKMAIRHGANLVPVYGFGENDIYEQVPNPPGSFVRFLQNKLQRLLGFAPCLFVGRGVFQYSFGIVPFRKPIYTVVGAPIETVQNRNPTTEEIDALHKKYVDALVELYNTYKDRFAEDPSVPLEIL